MNSENVVEMFTYVAQLFPAQRFDEFTPDIWDESITLWQDEHGIDIDPRTARLAVLKLSHTERWFNLADLFAKIVEIRGDRIDQQAITAARTADPDEPISANAELRRLISALGDGRAVNVHLAITPGEAPRPADSAAYRQLRADMSNLDPDLLADRERAGTVECRRCGQDVGSTCVGPDGRPLTRTAAHTERLEDAGVMAAAPARDREQQIAELARRIDGTNT